MLYPGERDRVPSIYGLHRHVTLSRVDFQTGWSAVGREIREF